MARSFVGPALNPGYLRNDGTSNSSSPRSSSSSSGWANMSSRTGSPSTTLLPSVPETPRPWGWAPGLPSSHRSNPAAITVTRTSSSISSSMTVPKMMLASGWATAWMISIASFTSKRPSSGPPAMFTRIPRAPSMEFSSSGEVIAPRAAFDRPTFSRGVSDTHDRGTRAVQDHADVGEVGVDLTGDGDEIRDPLDPLK